jgi:hypothetical protein
MMPAECQARLWILSLALWCPTAVATADPPTTQPQKTWSLPGLSGTAQQIKVELHQEINELNAKIVIAQGDVRAAQAETAKHRQLVIAGLGQWDNANYRYVTKTLADSQSELATTNNRARADELRVKIEGFTKRLHAIQDQAVAANPDTPKYLAAEDRHQADVARLQNDLAKCIAWRSEIGAGVRGGLALQWPVREGSTGIIGAMRIDHVLHSGQVAAEGSIFEPLSQDAKQVEGIATVRGRAVPAKFLIDGWTDRKAGEGEQIFMDQMVRVTACDGDRDGLFLRVQRTPCDEDQLLADFHEFMKAGEGDMNP